MLVLLALITGKQLLWIAIEDVTNLLFFSTHVFHLRVTTNGLKTFSLIFNL